MKDYEFEINERYRRIFGLKGYLASTDYQRLRELDGGEPTKEDVKQKRINARKEINKLETEIGILEDEWNAQKESESTPSVE